jgi:hypothetical protein
MHLPRSLHPFSLILVAALPAPAQATLALSNESNRTWYVVADMPAQWLNVRTGKPSALGPAARVAILRNSHWRLDPGGGLELATLPRPDGTAPDLCHFLQVAPSRTPGGPARHHTPRLEVGGRSGAFRWAGPAALDRASQVGMAISSGGRNEFVFDGPDAGAGPEGKVSTGSQAAGAPPIESKSRATDLRPAGNAGASPRKAAPRSWLAGGPRIATGYRIVPLERAPAGSILPGRAAAEPPAGALVLDNPSSHDRYLAFPQLAGELLVEIRPPGPGLPEQRLLEDPTGPEAGPAGGGMDAASGFEVEAQAP